MIKVSGLVSGYGKIKILCGIDIDIGRGEIVSLIGRNGVGKSTLMKTIMGLIKPMSGSVRLNDIDFTKKPPYLRAIDGVGFVEQGHGIFPALSVEENLQMGFSINNMKKTGDLDIAYEYFPILYERRLQKAGSLSGGERAIVSIARVLVCRPKIILLDEPSEGVQPNIVHQIGDIILRSSQDMGLTVLMVEQNLKLIQSISQRCYTIDKGKITNSLSRVELLDDEIVQSYLKI